ncbi:hypothetical protein BDW22DRAFT_135184 [Trametopsis cervina]|nr:hypothetical protein BDW22DRAFT_135184 [Trametopsis cervina]
MNKLRARLGPRYLGYRKLCNTGSFRHSRHAQGARAVSRVACKSLHRLEDLIPHCSVIRLSVVAKTFSTLSASLSPVGCFLRKHRGFSMAGARYLMCDISISYLRRRLRPPSTTTELSPRSILHILNHYLNPTRLFLWGFLLVRRSTTGSLFTTMSVTMFRGSLQVKSSVCLRETKSKQ